MKLTTFWVTQDWLPFLPQGFGFRLLRKDAERSQCVHTEVLSGALTVFFYQIADIFSHQRIHYNVDRQLVISRGAPTCFIVSPKFSFN